MKRSKRMTASFMGNMRLRNKLIAAFCVLALVPVTALGVYAYCFMQRSIVERVEEGIENSAFQLKERVDYQIQKYAQVLQYLMYDNQIASIFDSTTSTYYETYYNMEEIYEPMLLSVREMNGELAQIGIYTDNPQLRTRGTSVIRFDEAEPPQSIQNALCRHGIQWDIRDGMLIGTGRVMRLHQQSPNSVTYLQVPVKALLDFDMSTVRQYGLAVFAQQELLFSSVWGGMDLAPGEWLSQGDATGRIDGQNVLVVRQPMDEQGWEIVFCCPYEQLDIDMSSLMYMICIAVLVSAVTLIAVSVITSNSITGRIRRLNQAIERVEAGQMQVHLQAREKDEIGDLFRHFNNMLQSLNDYIQSNYQNKITLREAEMKMLQAQINPHFLYNALSMINWMALEKEETEISEVLMQLSQFYRMILNRGNFTVQVWNEVENITCYLELQDRLHESAYDTELQFSDDILENTMIGMILQPIAENAIEHGIDLLRDRRGSLKIKGWREMDTLWFTVSDNGPGMSREKFVQSLSKSTKGYGLKNVHDRLQIAYGSDYGLTMLDGEGQGTTIAIRIPSSAEQPTAAASDRVQ